MDHTKGQLTQQVSHLLCFKGRNSIICLINNTTCYLSTSTVTIRKVISERDRLQAIQGQTAAQQLIEGQTSNVTIDSPRQRYGRSRKRVTPDRFDKDTIRRLIYDFYEQKQHVTVTKLLKQYGTRNFLVEGRHYYGNFYTT